MRFESFSGRSFLKGDMPFILLFVVFAIFYYHSYLNKGPLNVHLWRQTDCLSITHFYKEGVPFFQPEMYIQLADNNTSGKTAGEFPLLYYIVGKLWRIFGESYLSYRLFYLLILFAGTYAFYKTIYSVFGDRFWATGLALLLFTSPVYVNYGISFLTDVPAISFILIALFFLQEYARRKKWIPFVLSMAFFVVAGLIKVSSMIAFLYLFFIFLLEIFPVKSLGKQKLFHTRTFEFAEFLLVFLLIFAWYVYAHHYNKLHGLNYTYNNIYPFWKIKGNEIHSLFRNIKNFTSLVYFSRSVLYTLIAVGIVNFLLVNKIPLFAFLANIVIILGSVMYFVLWAPLMGVHDYYFAALLILFLGTLLPFLWYVKKNHPDWLKNPKIRILFGVFLLYNFIYCYQVTELKTFAEKGRYVLVGNNHFVGFMKWSNRDVREKWKRFEEMRGYLRDLGITREDKVISLPDKSFNVSLYLMGQKGWTDFMNYSKPEDIMGLVRKGAKYLFIADPALLRQDLVKPFISDQIGNYKGIYIFKLHNR